MNEIFNGYCLIFKSEICEGMCVEIIHELTELKKEEHLIYIKKYVLQGKTNSELIEVCRNCPNSSYELRNYIE